MVPTLFSRRPGSLLPVDTKVAGADNASARQQRSQLAGRAPRSVPP